MAGFKRTSTAPPKKVEAFTDVQSSLEALASAINAHSDELDKINGGVTLASNTPGIIKVLSFAMPNDPPFTALTVGAGWSAVSSHAPKFLMTPGGKVITRGALSAGAAVAPSSSAGGSSVLGTLPVGYRPLEQSAFAGGASLAGVETWAGIGLKTDGKLFLSSAGSATCDVVGIDSLEWFAVNAAPPHQFVGSGWPLRVRHGFPKCNVLVPLGFRFQNVSAGQNVGVGAPVVDWQDLGDGSLRINGVWGLQWGQRYEMRLYLSPEEKTESAP